MWNVDKVAHGSRDKKLVLCRGHWKLPFCSTGPIEPNISLTLSPFDLYTCAKCRLDCQSCSCKVVFSYSWSYHNIVWSLQLNAHEWEKAWIIAFLRCSMTEDGVLVGRKQYNRKWRLCCSRAHTENTNAKLKILPLFHCSMSLAHRNFIVCQKTSWRSIAP